MELSRHEVYMFIIDFEPIHPQGEEILLRWNYLKVTDMNNAVSYLHFISRLSLGDRFDDILKGRIRPRQREIVSRPGCVDPRDAHWNLELASHTRQGINEILGTQIVVRNGRAKSGAELLGNSRRGGRAHLREWIEEKHQKENVPDHGGPPLQLLDRDSVAVVRRKVSDA